MIIQIMDKMGDYADLEEDAEEDAKNDADAAMYDKDYDKADGVVREEKKQMLEHILATIKTKYPELSKEMFIDYIKTQYDELLADDSIDILDDFEQFVQHNYDSLDEKKGKDHDGDGDVDKDDYMAAKDKAIKKAMGKDESVATVNEYRGSGDEIIEVIKQMAMEMDGDEIEAAMEVMEFIGEHYKIDFEFGRAGGGNYGRNTGAPYEGKASKKPMGKDEIVKENIKAIITRVLEEQVIAEAATANLSNWGEGYAGFDGVKTVVNDLENIVTEIESFYDKVADKIANAFEKTKEFRNLDGMQVGAFIAPSLEAAFKKDLRPVTKTGFFNKIELPKVRTISQADIDANNSGERPLGEEEKQTVFSAPTVNGTLRESKK